MKVYLVQENSQESQEVFAIFADEEDAREHSKHYYNSKYVIVVERTLLYGQQPSASME